ncbi:MAG TPA: flavin reductase [Ancylobacter sp.]
MDSTHADFPTVSAREFRDGMARLGAAVNIATTDGPGGRAGFTASAVCSVTDTPPTLLVCLNRSTSVFEAVTRNGVLCVNTLAAGHEELSGRFGGKTPMAERFEAGAWSALVTGSPVLAGAAASFDCRIVQHTSIGSHNVMFCEVVAITPHLPAAGLIYFNRRYHSVKTLET